MKLVVKLLTLGLFVALVAGCTLRDDITAPTPGNVTGTWNISGAFNGWGNTVMTNDPASYTLTGVIDIVTPGEYEYGVQTNAWATKITGATPVLFGAPSTGAFGAATNNKSNFPFKGSYKLIVNYADGAAPTLKLTR